MKPLTERQLQQVVADALLVAAGVTLYLPFSTVPAREAKRIQRSAGRLLKWLTPYEHETGKS